MSNSTTMTYGDYSFSPVPLVNIERQYSQKKNRVNPLGYTFQMTLSGVLTTLPDLDDGIINLDSLMEDLRSAFNRDGKRFQIKCGATEVITTYPRILSLSFAEGSNNWIQSVPFTIVIEYDNDDLNEHPAGEVPPYIEDYTEEWQFEFDQEKKYFTWDLSGVSNQNGSYSYPANDSNNPFEARVTHTVSVIGKQGWTGAGATGTEIKGVDNALNWVNTVFAGFSYNASYGHAVSGWTNLLTSGYGIYDHFRAHTINETEGNINLTETWLVVGNNTGLGASARKCSEDFTVSVRNSNEDGRVNVSVEGQIRGFETRVYTPYGLTTNTSEASYDNAATAWASIETRVFPRAQKIYQEDNSGRLNPSPVNKSIGHQPSRGIISYSYEFNDRPCAFITGALSENFTIIDNHPTDVFASLPVIGRAQGPVLQDISTVTQSSKQVSIEAVMPGPTGCSSISDLELYNPSVNVGNLLCQFETQLTGAYDQVFKSEDNENWSPNTGRYSRTVTWVYAKCSGSISTSFC